MTTRPTATAAEWYRVCHLAHGVTQVYERFIAPYYRCNVWHVRGRDRDLLVDTGMGVVSLVGRRPAGRRWAMAPTWPGWSRVRRRHVCSSYRQPFRASPPDTHAQRSLGGR